MTNEEISEMLIRFLDGRVTPWEFDDFISIPQVGDLERYRLEIVRIRANFPPENPSNYCNDEGRERIKEIAGEIRLL